MLGRHWYHALDNLDKKVAKNEGDNYFNGLQEEVVLEMIYQNLPHWRPIRTLDSLILLKKSSMI